jgi:phage terminase large subunit GpA-like protein
MARCDHCGNEYDKSFTVTVDESTHTFDSFECAIHMLAPTCSHCGCRIIGHGVEAASGRYFCCVNCAEKAGISGLRVRQPATHA